MQRIGYRIKRRLLRIVWAINFLRRNLLMLASVFGRGVGTESSYIRPSLPRKMLASAIELLGHFLAKAIAYFVQRPVIAAEASFQLVCCSVQQGNHFIPRTREYSGWQINSPNTWSEYQRLPR